MMKENEFCPIRRTRRSHRVQRPSQTGFSSPATHYTEPRIDLNEVLAANPSATFHVRVVDDSFKAQGIAKNDVLIIDRALPVKVGQLVMAVQDGSFTMLRIAEGSQAELTIWGTVTYIIKSVL